MSANHNNAEDSPLRSLAGPSRLRSEARQARTSLSKPYARKSATGLASYSEENKIHSRDSLGNVHRSPRKSLVGDSTANNDSSASKTTSATSSVGLFSGLRDALFAKPLSWLSRGGSRSDVRTVPQSRSTSFVASTNDRTEDGDRSNSRASIQPSSFTAPTDGRRDTGSTPFRSNIPKQSLHASRSLGSELRAHSPARSQASATAQVRSHGRDSMSIEPVSPSLTQNVVRTPGYARGGSQTGNLNGSVSNLSNAHSSASFAYGFGSERRLAGLGSGSGISHSPLHVPSSYAKLPSRSPFAVQHRSLGGSLSSQRGMGRSSIAGGELGRYDASPRSAHRSLGQITTPSRPISMFNDADSRAGSIAGSRASSRNKTPKRREWSSLNIAPPNTNRSEGEELMREYLAIRKSDRSALPGELRPHGLVGSSETDRQRAGGDVYEGQDGASIHAHTSGVKATKRGLDDADEEMMSETSQQPQRKRQMVWDADLGFVTRQEQRANQPQKPLARNEAERLLNALEGMRSPLGDAYRAGNARSATPSQDMIKVPVPLSASSSVAPRPEYFVKAVSPYARALRNNRLTASMEPERSGLRSRLRRENGRATESLASSRYDDQMSVSSRAAESEVGDVEDERRDGAPSEESSDDNAMEVLTDEDVAEPPRKRSGLIPRSDARGNADTTPKSLTSAESIRTLQSGKVVATATTTPSKKGEGSKTALSDSLTSSPATKPMSKARIGISMGSSSSATSSKQYTDRQALFGTKEIDTVADATTRPSTSKPSTFNVRVDDAGSSADSQQSRTRSSLRQGAEKTSRTHAKSGRVGLDDEADGDNSMDDSPSTEELDKIKLPTNLFPTGFAFGSTSSSVTPATTISTGVKSGEAESNHGQEAGGPSLLSRLGGFAPEAEKSLAKDSAPPTTPTFSFGSPAVAVSSAASTSKPILSFQPSVSSPLAAPSGSSSAPSNSSTSNFFAAPPSVPTSKTDTPEATTERKNGPVPNFFASSLAKTSAPATSSTETAKTASAPSFSFAKPAEASSSSPFTFGQPSQSSEQAVKATEAKNPVFSFGQASSSSNSNTTVPTLSGKDESKTDAATSSSGFTGFGNASNASSTAPAFSFGSTTPSIATLNAKQKRDVSDDVEQGGEPQQKKVSFGGLSSSSSAGKDSSTAGPSFTFGNAGSGFGQTNTAASNPPSSSSSAGGGFTFGGPAKTDTEVSKAASSSGFSFGSAPTTVQTQTTDKPTFSFGAAALSQSADKSGFSFGGTSSNANKSNAMDASSPPSSTTNAFPAFGAPSSASAISMPAKPAFTFGAPQSSSPSPLQVSSPTGAAAPSTGFSFGANASSKPGTPPVINFGNSAQQQPANPPIFGSTASGGGFGGSHDNSRQGSPAPFAFGQPQQQSGFGANNGNPPSVTTSGFSFGATAGPAATQSQPATNGGGFSFSMPMGAGSGSTSQPGFGAPMGAGGGGSGTPPPFVFGAPSNGSAPSAAAPTNAFQFGQSASGGGMGSGATTPTQQAAPANSLFNIGGPSSSSSPAGNRVVRGMPSRRKKA